MGSTESTLPSMEETTRSASDNNHNIENQNREIVSVLRRELRRETDTSLSNDIPGGGGGDDPWWWEIENENLLLDRIPNVTANSDLEEEAAREETANGLSEDFNTLLKIGEIVNLGINMEKNPNETAVDDAIIEKEIKLNCESTTEYSKSNDINETLNYTRHEVEEREPSVPTQSLEEFKEELRLKRMARQTAVQDLRDEITTLRKQLATEQELTRRLRRGAKKADAVDETFELTDSKCEENIQVESAVGTPVVVDEDDENVLSRSRHANIELANAQLALQLATSENLSLRTELSAVQKQVGTLKEVVACCKQMMAMKEDQCTQLKTKLGQIEESFGEREMKIMSDNLRQEYERQLGNIRQLRQLYEERQRIAAAEHENLQRLISIKKDELTAEQERTKSFEERNQTLLKEVETANNELAALREECNEHKFEKKAVKEEMGAVNTLFSQMVMGFSGKNNLDIDRLATMLEENRTLLNDMATKEINCSDGATLPKLLFELVEQASVSAANNNKESRSPTPTAMATREHDAEEDDVGGGGGNNVVCTLDSLKNHQGAIEQRAADNDGQSVVDSIQTTQNVATVVIGDEIAGTDNSIVTPNAEDNETANININPAAGNNEKQHQRKSAATTTTISSNSNNSKTEHLTSSSAAAASSTSTFKLHEPEVIGKVASTQEIIGNLPKVWKVLMELLSHHKIEQVQFEENGAGEDCYKSVETPNGPKAELSVSKTYIKLKDLILEKKSLVKETNRLKTLNCHLDYRLNEQEKRLSAVSLELTKTWHLVGKMQRQHRQLHTQEQILRYQLQQKRRLLSELKDELEYCRRKWAAARAKNDESQEQYNDLRREFAQRKLDDANNSAESGYSDSGPPSDEEEHGRRNKATTTTGGTGSSGGGSGGCSYKRDLRKMFEHSRKIKRMQSTSPGRAADGEIELRWNSAPPTCGWRAEYDDDEGGAIGGGEEEPTISVQGAVPKRELRTSRSKQRLNAVQLPDDDVGAIGMEEEPDAEQKSTNGDRAVRIQRLEEQCKSLIQQVLETSDNRERLEIQLCQFQDEIAPVQYAIPLEEFISKKRLERMTRASSVPASPGTLTPREEEYTRKRSERLGRLEEESRQLISRIKRTSDRGHYLRCSVDRLHRDRVAVSREGSFESNTEEDTTAEGGATATEEEDLRNSDAPKETSEDECALASKNLLTATEEAYTVRRAERLKRLEEESKQLLNKLSHNAQRGSAIGGKLDALHEKYGSSEECTGGIIDEQEDKNHPTTVSTSVDSPVSPTIEKRIENIERISSNRDERLRILEEEGKQLISRLSSTSARGTRMINRIAEREQNRLARQSETPNREVEETTTTKTELDVATKTASMDDDEAEKSQVSVDHPHSVVVAGALLPPLKNVACSSIVSEELAECVTVTTTASQIAGAQQGAIPKSKPLAQLCAGRIKPKQTAKQNPSETESLEDMVKRLKDLPFPDEQHSAGDDEQQKEDPQHNLDKTNND